MRLIDRYVSAELFVPLLIGGGTILMMLVGNTLYACLQDALRNHWPAAFVFRLLIFNIPIVMVLCLPVGAALGSALAVGRLGRDNELTVLRSVGISLQRALAPVFVAGLALSLFGGWIAERVVPWAWREQQNVGNLLGALPANPIEFSQTLNLPRFNPEYVVSFETASKTGNMGFRVGDVTLIDLGREPGAAPGSWPRVIAADYADYGSNLFTLSNVGLYEFEPSGLARFESAKIAKGELSQRVDFQQAANGLPEEQLAYLSFDQLTRMRSDSLRFRDTNRALQCDANRWFKFALPLMSLPCALFGASLALRFARGGSFAGILLSLGVVFASYAVLSGMKYAAIAGTIPALPAACVAPTLFLIIAGVHLRRQE